MEHNRILIADKKVVRAYHLKHKLNESEENSFRQAKTCDLCHEAFIDNLEKRSQIKVRNHCHNSGKFLGAVHSQCNTQYKDMSPHIILAHNGNKFDNHFVIDSISMHNDS